MGRKRPIEKATKLVHLLNPGPDTSTGNPFTVCGLMEIPDGDNWLEDIEVKTSKGMLHVTCPDCLKKSKEGPQSNNYIGCRQV